MEKQKTLSRVLIVDDDPYSREALTDILSSEQYELFIAEDGYSALKLATEHLPDVILLDVMMPGLDGFTVCTHLRSHAPTSEIPVIMLTALDDRSSLLRGIDAGADEFLTKPYDITELRTRVRAIVRLNRYRRLQQERRKFEQVVEHSETGYAIVDGEGRIRFANPSLCSFLGRSSGDITLNSAYFCEVAQQIYNCEPAEDWESWPEPLPDSARRLLVRPSRNETPSQWLQVDVTYDLSDQMETAWLVSVTDISQVVEQRLNMFSFQRMVAHKLRTPVSIALLAADMLESGAKKLSADQISLYAKNLYISTRELSNRINDVIQYAEINELSLKGTPLCLDELGAIFNEVAKEYDIKSVSIEERGELHSLESTRIALSSVAYRFICHELFENAQKFHPQHTPSITLSISASDTGTVNLDIIDDGAFLDDGVSSKRIGTPYYQYEPAFTGNLDGMGLGLASITVLMWNVGGSLQFRNRPNEPGVIISLQIPVINE